MSVDPTTAFARYGQIMERLRVALVPIRDEFTNWLRDFYRTHNRTRTGIRFSIDFFQFSSPRPLWG